MKEHKLKDTILNHLSISDSTNIKSISEHFNIDYYQACYIVDGFIEDDLVDYRDTNSKDSSPHEKVLSINHRGRYFLSQSGGYSKINELYKLNKIWTILKTVAATVNALAILYIAFWSVTVADKSKEVEIENQILHSQIDSLIETSKDISNYDSLK